MKDKHFVYADNAATTQVSPRVFDVMLPYLKERYGNPSSIYEMGRAASGAVIGAREQVAGCLGANPTEIYFTASGSESNNWAIKGIACAMAKKGKKHIITSSFEHHAVLHTVEALKKEGFEITLLPVYGDGIVRVEDVKNAIREDTALVTVMYANNEIGTIQPIAEIGAVCRDKGVLFHTDAVQAIGNVEIDVAAQNIDLLSLTGHKVYAPKGIGALYIRKGVPRFANLIDGGGQEAGRRAGTENVAFIAALGKAMELVCADIPKKVAAVTPLRNQLIDGLLKLPHTRLNGDREKRLPGNVNISFEGIEGESLLLMLDMHGIAASSGSACTSGSLDPSHVLLSIGLIHEVAHGSLRLSINEHTTREDIGYMLRIIPLVVERLRNMSPLWDAILAKQA